MCCPVSTTLDRASNRQLGPAARLHSLSPGNHLGAILQHCHLEAILFCGYPCANCRLTVTQWFMMAILVAVAHSSSRDSTTARTPPWGTLSTVGIGCSSIAPTCTVEACAGEACFGHGSPDEIFGCESSRLVWIASFRESEANLVTGLTSTTPGPGRGCRGLGRGLRRGLGRGGRRERGRGFGFAENLCRGHAALGVT
jgi:hypothetical protein